MAEIVQIVWDNEPGGNVEHMAEHGVTPEEAEAVIRARFNSRESSMTNPMHWVVDGFTPANRAIRVVFAYLEDLDVVVPVTAYERTRKDS